MPRVEVRFDEASLAQPSPKEKETHGAKRSKVFNLPQSLPDQFVALTIDYFENHNQLSLLTQCAAEQEIVHADTPADMFRGETFAARLLSRALLNEEGLTYLTITVLGIVDKVVGSADGKLELDLNGSNKPDQVMGNFKALLELVKKFFKKLDTSIYLCPIHLRQVMLILKTKISRKFPNLSADSAAAAILFLHYFNAALISPLKLGLCANELTLPQTRTLVIITKIIQAIANGTGHFTTQISNLQTIPALLSEFVKKQTPVIRDYIAKLMEESEIRKMEKIVPQKRAPFAERNASMQALIDFLNHQLEQIDPGGGKSGSSAKSNDLDGGAKKASSHSPPTRSKHTRNKIQQRHTPPAHTTRKDTPPKLKDSGKQSTAPELLIPPLGGDAEGLPKAHDRRSAESSASEDSFSTHHTHTSAAVAVPGAKRAEPRSLSSRMSKRKSTTALPKIIRSAKSPILPPSDSTARSDHHDLKPSSLPPHESGKYLTMGGRRGSESPGNSTSSQHSSKRRRSGSISVESDRQDAGSDEEGEVSNSYNGDDDTSDDEPQLRVRRKLKQTKSYVVSVPNSFADSTFIADDDLTGSGESYSSVRNRTSKRRLSDKTHRSSPRHSEPRELLTEETAGVALPPPLAQLPRPRRKSSAEALRPILALPAPPPDGAEPPAIPGKKAK